MKQHVAPYNLRKWVFLTLYSGIFYVNGSPNRSDIFVWIYRFLPCGRNIGSCSAAGPKLELEILPPYRLFLLHCMLNFVKAVPRLR